MLNIHKEEGREGFKWITAKIASRNGHHRYSIFY